jgi:hypothetical protein
VGTKSSVESCGCIQVREEPGVRDEVRFKACTHGSGQPSKISRRLAEGRYIAGGYLNADSGSQILGPEGREEHSRWRPPTDRPPRSSGRAWRAETIPTRTLCRPLFEYFLLKAFSCDKRTTSVEVTVDGTLAHRASGCGRRKSGSGRPSRAAVSVKPKASGRSENLALTLH